MAPAGMHSVGLENKPNTKPRRHWWLEWEVGLLMLLVLGIYFSRLSEPSIRGEESRRAQVGVEMISSGDWIVPRQQGRPFYSRPPLQNWLIAGVGLSRGAVDVVAIRLPSVVCILLTALWLYAYSRSFLSRLGSFAAAAAFATMGQVVQLGRLGETEALFTLLVSGSLLTWHLGFVRKWPAVWTWGAAYCLVALATLAKGLQAPVYFAASVGLFMLVNRTWRYAISWSHLVGILLFLLTWGSWQVPYYLEMGLDGARRIYLGDVGLRFQDTHWVNTVQHLATYPLELLGCTLPWSILLIAYFHRDFRRLIGSARGHFLFLVCCVAVTLPTVWLPPGSRTRYFMPIYPCLALLAGLVVQRCWDAELATKWRRAWGRFLIVAAIVMLGAGVVILVVTLFGRGKSPIGQPAWFALVYAISAVALAAVTLWSWRAMDPLQRMAGVLGVAVFVGFTYTGVVVNSQVHTRENTAEAVAELKRRLPENARLVSFGLVDHLFAFYYRRPIVAIPLPAAGGLPGREVTYFCSGNDASPPVEVDFPWEPVAVISCERSHRAKPRRVVVVGRRVPTRQADIPQEQKTPLRQILRGSRPSGSSAFVTGLDCPGGRERKVSRPARSFVGPCGVSVRPSPGRN